MKPVEAASEDRLLSLEEFALAIGKSVRTVSRYVRQQRIRTVSVMDQGRAALRIPISELSHGGHDGRHVADMEDGDLSDIGQQLDPSDEILMAYDGRQTAVADVRHEMADTQRFVSAIDMLTRYEAAAVRLGWVEGQLDMTRRMLSDGGHREAELVAKAEAEREARLKAEFEAAARTEEARRAAEEAERRERAIAAELEATRSRLAQLELEQSRPWWKKLFSGGS